MKIKICTAIALMLIAVSVCSAETIELNSDSVPPGMPTTVRVGKVTYQSLAEVSPAVRQVAQCDLASVARGYEIMSDPVAERKENYKNRLRRQADIEPLIKGKLADISKTELMKYEYEGIIPNGPTIDGPWTSLIRVYKRSDGVKIFFEEYDYVADGGSVFIIKELMNSKVKKSPAHVVLKKAQTGSTLTELGWADNKKYYTISVWDDASNEAAGSKYGKAWLLKLAEKIE